MQNDLQKASLWKRIAAGILDLILIAVLATGFGWAISAVTNYDYYFETYKAEHLKCAEKYGIDLELTAEQIEQMSTEEKQAYDEKVALADAEIRQNEVAIYHYNMSVNLSLIIVTGGILLAMILLELVVPILFGNGQTLGKKAFSLSVIRTDGVKMNGYQHFTRVILGKYAVETMIPVYVVVMLLGQPNGFLLLFVIVLLIAQVVILAVTKTNALLHDLMAGTVVVDHSSQKIFKSTQELIDYQKRIAAERAARQTY